MKAFRRIAIACWVLMDVVQLFAHDTIPVARLSIQNGLSNNSVRCIYQDRKGFIWMGTYDGLNRYDGYQFKVFRNKPGDSTSIPHNYIYTIHEDVSGDLWIGTGQGIAVYDNIHEGFSPAYFLSTETKRKEKILFNANAITSDKEGNVYIGSNGWGLLVKRKGKDLAKSVPAFVHGVQVTSYNARGLTVIDGRLWMVVLDAGLCVYDVHLNKVTLVDPAITSAECMVYDDRGNIWIGGENGLYQFSIAQKKYIASFKDSPGKLNSSHVTSLCMDKQQNLWIGTDDNGINILWSVDNTFSYLPKGEKKNSLSSEAIYSIIKDNEARLWIGTLKGGCNVVDMQENNFQTIERDPFASNTLPSNFIYSFCESGKNELLVGTDGGGLSVWNRQNNSFRNYQHEAGNLHSLSHNSVAGIRKDYLGNIWVATYGGGINKFNAAAGTFEHYTCRNVKDNIENKNVLLLYEDNKHTLWAATFSYGKLYTFNRTANRFDVFSQRLNNIISVLEDSNGNFWAGDATELIKVDRSGAERHVVYAVGKPVRAIFMDSKNRLWLGSEGQGLLLFNTDSGKVIKRLTDADGLCNNAILNIEEDEAGCLWLSTFDGLSRYNPGTNEFKNFYQSDGLQSNQFSYRAALKLSKGEMAFGGINGFNIFKPATITERAYMPPLFITSILINNKPVTKEERFISNAGIAGISELKIPYDQAVLSFGFNALEYAAPDKIMYAYYLQGWDKDWNYSGNIRNINYNNIREGSYTLHIKSTNANGEWNPRQTLLSVIILPPWYRTWWAYLCYMAAAMSIFYAIYRYRMEKNRLTHKIALAQVNAEKEREINESRQSFFTNITHEFRTPLTLIINPLSDILEKEEEGQQKARLNFVYRHARRLLSLVDQLLLFRKTESDTGQLHLSQFDLAGFSREVFLYFSQQAKAKNISYIFESSDETLEIVADKEKLEIILFNLLSNALKYTPGGGEVIFGIEEKAHDIIISVSDTGRGIPAGTGDLLFEKYYRVNQPAGSQKPGFGIGLYLVKQFVDKHKGNITYRANPGGGSIFSASFLKGRTHFGNEPIAETDTTESQLVEELRAGYEPPEPIEKTPSDGLDAMVSEKKTILIVDDNQQMRGYLAQVFEAYFVVQEASSGEEGVRMARELQPDVIISDVVMEVMSGIDFCKAIKESPTSGHIPFILLTGSYSPEARLQSIEYGADDYIAKPFEKDLLVARVQGLIRKQDNLQKYFYNEITHKKNDLNISGEYKAFLESCIAIVEKHLDNSEFNIDMLAKEIGMSHSKLYRLIKTISGQSVSAFIRFIRLRKAAEMFINTNYNVGETGFYVGIKDIRYFREQFAKTFGLKPSEYISKYRKSLGKNYKLNEKAVNKPRF